jgi:hypothetical protein
MFASLESVDTVVLDQATGRRCCVQTDHRTAEEIRQQEEISILFALTRVLGARVPADSQDVEVLYVCAEPPPDFLRHAVASAGGRMAVHEGPSLPYDGPLSAPADLADRAFRHLAQRVLRERRLPLDESTLETLERAYAQAPDREEDEQEYWTHVVTLAAVAGELLRARWGGRWIHMPGLAALPFAFSHSIRGSSRSLVSNAVGKAQRFLNHGEYENLVALLDGAEDHADPNPPERPVLLTLKAMNWDGHEEMRCQPLFTPTDPKALVPWVVYGEDLPHSFRYFTKEETREQELSELHARALENLKAIHMEPERLELLGSPLLVVLGHHYTAEKVMDVEFMRSLHERLGADWLMVGIPRRGSLIAAKARGETSFVQGFRFVCEKQFRRGDFEPLCPTPLLLHEGKISGIASEKEVRAALSGGVPAKPWWGFFRRLFGRTQG